MWEFQFLLKVVCIEVLELIHVIFDWQRCLTYNLLFLDFVDESVAVTLYFVVDLHQGQCFLVPFLQFSQSDVKRLFLKSNHAMMGASVSPGFELGLDLRILIMKKWYGNRPWAWTDWAGELNGLCFGWQLVWGGWFGCGNGWVTLLKISELMLWRNWGIGAISTLS